MVFVLVPCSRIEKDNLKASSTTHYVTITIDDDE